LLAGQPGQVLGADRRLEARERTADQQWPLLPVIAQALLRRHAQRRQRAGIDFDRWGSHGRSVARSRSACGFSRVGAVPPAAVGWVRPGLRSPAPAAPPARYTWPG